MAEFRSRHIDPHVHFRGFEQKAVMTIGRGMEIARSQGIVAVCDMPNTSPAITSAAMVEKRFKEAEEEGVKSGYYIYIGATANENQLKEAMRVATEHPKVVGIKLYAGVSTGDLAVINPADQRNVYKIARQEGYRGILIVHCEEESCGCGPLWNPRNPWTWNLAKPPVMEMVGIANQIKFAKEEKFPGHLHVAHASTPRGVKLVNTAKQEGMRITCGVTPHHLSYSTANMLGPETIELKVNPPIRPIEMTYELRKLLRIDGVIDWIETDFAPHPVEKKTFDPDKPPNFYASGISKNLTNYAKFLEHLLENGITAEQIERLTYSNIKAIYTKITE